MNAFDLHAHDLTVAEIHRNLPPGALYEHALRYEKDASIADNGALGAYSGAKTGRSPKMGVLTVANHFAPKGGLLSIDCSATADRETGRSSLLFGLSGTGKTTLS